MMALCLLLSGCTGGSEDLDLVQSLREEYSALTECAGTAEITADYGQRVYDYTVEFSLQGEELTLTITAPEEVAGITAHVSGEETALSFDGVMLETGPLTEDGLSPVSALPFLLRCVSQGFSDSCGWEEDGEAAVFRVDYRDPEAEPDTGTQASVWFDQEEGALLRGELYSDGHRVILCRLTEFSMAAEEI